MLVAVGPVARLIEARLYAILQFVTLRVSVKTLRTSTLYNTIIHYPLARNAARSHWASALPRQGVLCQFFVIPFVYVTAPERCACPESNRIKPSLITKSFPAVLALKTKLPSSRSDNSQVDGLICLSTCLGSPSVLSSCRSLLLRVDLFS